MILVDILVPSVATEYDFQLDEDAMVVDIIGEIAELVGQKEHSEIVGNIDELMLCKMKDDKVLSKNLSLRACGVQTGDSLMLV